MKKKASHIRADTLLLLTQEAFTEGNVDRRNCILPTQHVGHPTIFFSGDRCDSSVPSSTHLFKKERPLVSQSLPSFSQRTGVSHDYLCAANQQTPTNHTTLCQQSTNTALLCEAPASCQRLRFCNAFDNEIMKRA